ncbi:MAG TPA: ABC transporter permease [Bryobacteraceae bacterium]|nr:ABC transporter permease [Bryobacteraceae bacterium]
MITLVDDIRLGARALAKSPGFTLVVVATLALGIGLTTALFSLVDQLLLWSVPAREATRLVKIEGTYSRTCPFFRAYRDLNQVFDGVLASSNNLDAGLRPAGSRGVEIGKVEYVSGGYFQILGIGAAAGRVITPSDDTAGGPLVVVLSYRYWQRRFAGDLRVIGQQFSVNNYRLVVAGVAEKGFGGLFNGDEPDVLMALAMYPVTNPGAAQEWNTTRSPWLTCVARLKPGVSVQQAQASMPLLWGRAMERVNDRAVEAVTKAHLLPKDECRLAPAARDPFFIRNQNFLDPLKALAAATVLVLLLTCANVSNLLLVRASQRWKQTAVRLSLGATRGRLIRQFLTESLLLAALGSAMGLGVAYFGIRALAQLNVLDPDFRFHLSLFVLASCAGLTLLTTILFGLIPALRATRMKLAESMKEHGMATEALSRSLLSRFLIADQIALSLALLISASLFGRTLRNLQNVDLGFQRESIAIFEIDPMSVGYSGQSLRTFYDQFLERTRTLLGVRTAALAGMTPISNQMRGVAVGNEALQVTFRAISNPVSSGYFTTMGIPLLAGRDFRREDEPVVTPNSGRGRWDAPRVCIMDQSLARQQFGPVNAVGRRFCYPGSDCSGDKGIEVIGVVKDVHYGEITRPDPLGTIYEPSWSNGADARWLAVRFAGSAAPVIAAVRRALQDQDPNVPLLHVRLMEEYINSRLAHERLVAYLSSFFGILALGLASLGLSGVLACVVSRRTREIGIRMALGARRGDVVRMILRFSLGPVAAGLVIGVVVAFFWGLFLGSQFYGIDSFDPVSVSQSVAVLLAAALLAAALPARRATKVDPMAALRYE